MKTSNCLSNIYFFCQTLNIYHLQKLCSFLLGTMALFSLSVIDNVMDEMNTFFNWVKLAPFPKKFDVRTKPFLINNTEFIIADKDGFVNKYDINANEWTTSKQPLLPAVTRHFGQSYDPSTKCLYSYLAFGVNKLDLNNHQLTSYKLDNYDTQIAWNHSSYFKIPNDPQHHIIYGAIKTHEIWNENKPRASLICAHSNPWKVRNPRNVCIYIESRQEILMLGGSNSTEIWRYSITNNTWTCLDLTMPYEQNLHSFGCVITNDDRHIIIFSGMFTVDNRHIDTCSLYVLDMKNTKWLDLSKSNVCPLKGAARAIIVPHREKDENVVSAYVRFMCDDKINIDEIPLGVLGIIDSMYGGEERVHLFFDRRSDHYAINMSDILSNCT